MKSWLFALAFAAFIAPLHAAAAQVQVVDDRGKTIELREPPRRIVTLLPSLTETVCELGACDRLVGVDNFSNWPDRVLRLPHVGGLDDASIEQIVALKPDIVLLSATSRALGRLEGLGLRVMGLELKTLADVRRGLGKVGQLLDLPGAEQVWSRINEEVDAAARTLPKPLRGTTVYYEVGGGYAASESSHIGEILSRVGGANVVPGNLGTVPKLNPEFVVRADPQVIMFSDRNLAELPTRPGWSRIRAVREGRLCAFTAAQGDVIVRPGPRLGESARLMVQCLKGELKGRS